MNQLIKADVFEADQPGLPLGAADGDDIRRVYGEGRAAVRREKGLVILCSGGDGHRPLRRKHKGLRAQLVGANGRPPADKV